MRRSARKTALVAPLLTARPPLACAFHVLLCTRGAQLLPNFATDPLVLSADHALSYKLFSLEAE
jgi:hypothetical protein